MRTRLAQRLVEGLTLLTAVQLLSGCEFDPSGVVVPELVFQTYLDERAPFTEVTRQGGSEVVHAPGRLYIQHGFSCAEARTPNFVRVRGSLRLPPTPPNAPFTKAAVYLNGWRASFRDAESEAVGFGAAIRKVEFADSQSLRWEAGGGISGEDGGKAVEFCYWRTAIAWTDYYQDLVVIEEDALTAPARRGGAVSGLSHVPRFVQHSKVAALPWAGVLPMGFGMWWADLEEDYLLQTAYYMGPSEPYIYGNARYLGQSYDPAPSFPLSGATGIVDFVRNGFVSWGSNAIFKNGEEPDPFYLKDAATVLTGSRHDMIEPHFAISPTVQSAIGQYGPTSSTVTVADVPFHVAVPVLKGWNIYNHMDDEQIRDLGIWIDRIEWTRTGSQTGRLTYTVEYVITSNERVGHTGESLVAILGVRDVYVD